MNSSFDPVIVGAYAKAKTALARLHRRLHIKEIDDIAVKDWSSQWTMPSRYRRFPWGQLMHDLPAGYFSIAVYAGKKLCGLGQGFFLERSSNPNNTKAVLQIVEGAPYEHALKGHILTAMIVTTEIIAYEKELAIVRLDSINPAIPNFRNLPGYVSVSNGLSVEKRLTEGTARRSVSPPNTSPPRCG